MLDQIKQIMADILGLDARAIDGATSKERTSSWDSMNHVSLVLALEQEFGVLFEPADIEAMTSCNAVLEVLEKKLASPK
jgi:acyl carrier protein